jgi:DivIVA domain-containing protein
VAVIVVVLVGAGILVGVALLLSFTDSGMSEERSDHGDLGLPDRPLTAEDIPGLRFRTGVRGYRMEDVDSALERITEALRESQSGGATSPSTNSPTSGDQ